MDSESEAGGFGLVALGWARLRECGEGDSIDIGVSSDPIARFLPMMPLTIQ